MGKYNDNVTFQTDKKDQGSAKALKRFLYIGIGVFSVILLTVIIIVSSVNKKIDTRLKTLTIEEGMLSPDFDKDIKEYQVEVEGDSIYFTCAPINKKAKVDGCGKTIKLKDDENKVIITSKYKKIETKYEFNVIKTSKFDIEVSGNPEEWTDKDVKLTIKASSLEGIEMDEEGYSFDDGENFGKANEKLFTENEKVYIRVRDKDGNISGRQTILINKIDKNVPSVKVSVKKKKLIAVVEPNKTPSGYRYTWYKDGEKIEKANKVSYTAKVSGKYKVIVENGLGKKAESEEVTYSSGTTYAISYNANGGVDAPSDQIKGKDEDLTISSKTPTRDGYKFVGWSYTKDGKADLNVGDTYSKNKSCILYAVWEKSSEYQVTSPEKFTITYNGTGGSNVPAAQTKEKNKDIVLSSTIPQKADHSFLGWSKTNGGSVDYKAGSTFKENQSVTLYAVWQKMKTITVTYDGNGATVGKGTTSSNGTNTFTLPKITRNGYTVIGWATYPTATTANYKVGQKVTINSSTTLYAVTKKDVIATFQKNTASSIGTAQRSCTLYNRATLCSVKMPTITAKSGKKALGWATNANQTTASFAINSDVAISKNTTFYAITK